MSKHGEAPAGQAGPQEYIALGYTLLGDSRRSGPRVALSLPARCLFADGGEAPAVIGDASCSGLAVACYRSGLVGEPVIVAIDHLDRFDGRIVRRLQTGFAVELRMTRYRSERLRQTLERLAEAECASPILAAESP